MKQIEQAGEIVTGKHGTALQLVGIIYCILFWIMVGFLMAWVVEVMR